MTRVHGGPPYKTVFVHGGPGAIGSLKACACEASRLSNTGVVEALQSKYSIAGLIEELHAQVAQNCQEGAALVGHSWGAWLSVLFAKEYPELCKTIVLIGCPPLTDAYVGEISSRRMQNLSEKECEAFRCLTVGAATGADMEQIPNILEKADNYCLESSRAKEGGTDSEMYNRVCGEAAKLRTSGELLAAFRSIRSKLYLIQGDRDPHPAKGVTEPLTENGVPCEAYILEKCGHSPFMEKYAKEEFYRILLRIIL